MKNYLLIALMLAGHLAHSQFTKQTIGGAPTVMLTSKGPFKGIKGLVNVIFADTTAANVDANIHKEPGLMILAGDSLFVRSADTSRWLLISGTGITQGPGGIDSTTWTGCVYNIWQQGNNSPIDFCGFLIDVTLNDDSTYLLKWGMMGKRPDSLWLPADLVFGRNHIIVKDSGYIGRRRAIVIYDSLLAESGAELPWLLAGNALAPGDTSFIGTTTAHDLDFRINSVLRANLNATTMKFGNLSGIVGTEFSEIGPNFINFHTLGSFINSIKFISSPIGFGQTLTPYTGGSGTTLTGFTGSFLNTNYISSGFITSQYEQLTLVGTTYPNPGISMSFENKYSPFPPRLLIYSNGGGSDAPVSILPNDGNLIVGSYSVGDLRSARLNVITNPTIVRGAIPAPRMRQGQRDSINRTLVSVSFTAGSGYASAPTVTPVGTATTLPTLLSAISGGGAVNSVSVLTPGEEIIGALTFTVSGGGPTVAATVTTPVYASKPPDGLMIYNLTTEKYQHWDSVAVAWVDMQGSGGGGTLTGASRGLNVLSGIVRIGGTLDSAAIIDVNGKAFSIQGSSTTVPTFEVINSSATVSGPKGLRAESNAGTAVEVQTSTGLGVNITGLSSGRGLTVVTSSGTGITTSSATGEPLQSTKGSAAGNTMQRSLFLNTTTGVTPGAGVGTKIEFGLPSNVGGLASNGTISNSISSKFTTVTSGAETSELEITGIAAGSTSSWLNIKSNVLRIHNLADTLATLADIRSSAGINLYNSDGTFTGDRYADLNDKILSFNNLGDSWILLDPLGKNSNFTSHGDGGLGGLFIQSSTGNFNLNLAVTDGTNTPSIYEDAVTNTITHTGAYQVFNARDSISHYVSNGIDTVSIVENVTNNDIIFRATSSIFLHDVYVNGDLNVGGEIIRYRTIKREFTGSTALTITLPEPFTFFSVDVYKNGILIPMAEYTESWPFDVILASRLASDLITIRYNY